MVIIICHAFFGEGAVSARARAETKVFVQMGYQVIIITTTRRGLDGGKKKYTQNCRIITLSPLSIHRYIRKPARELTFAWKCVQYIKKHIETEKVDFIIYHPSVISLFIEPFCRKHNIISIFIVHSLVQELIRHRVNSLDILSTRLYHFTEKKAIKNSTYSVAISKYMRKHIQSIKKTKNNIIDLPNAIDIEFFAGAATNRTIDILFVGRLAREKGAMVLLNALAILSTKPSVYILGDGPDRQQLTAAAKSFNFDNIHFMGHIPHREINNWLCRTKLSIVPSWCEPQGIILMESMASGAALIGTNGGAIPEYIQHNKNGLLFPPGNTLALAEAIESLLNDPIKRNKLAKAALQTVKRCNRTKFSASLEKFVSCINTSSKTLKNNESDKIKQYT